jgi:hypothetical protein
MSPALRVKEARYCYTHIPTGEIRELRVGKVHLVNPAHGRSICGMARSHDRSNYPIRWASPPAPGNVTCIPCLKKAAKRTGGAHTVPSRGGAH